MFPKNFLLPTLFLPVCLVIRFQIFPDRLIFAILGKAALNISIFRRNL